MAQDMLVDSPECGSCDLSGVLGYPAGVLLAHLNLFLSRYVPFLDHSQINCIQDLVILPRTRNALTTVYM